MKMEESGQNIEITQREALLHNQEELKQKIAMAKMEGQKLAESKQRLTQLKAFIEKRRLKRSVLQLCAPSEAYVPEGSAEQPPLDHEEEKALQSLAEVCSAVTSRFCLLSSSHGDLV